MMRKFLMSLTVLAGATLAAASVPVSAANAAPSHPVLSPLSVPHVQTVQYYREDGRRREWRRHMEWERHRHEEWRRHHEYRRW